MGHPSVSIKSLKRQLALKLIPDWSRVGSHVEPAMQLWAAAPRAGSLRAEGWLQIKEPLVPVTFLYYLNFTQDYFFPSI